MNKIKEFFSTWTTKIITALVLIVGFLTYFLKFKNKELEALNAKINLAKTQKEADLLEVEIKSKLQVADASQAEANALQSSLDALEEKRKQLPGTDHNPEDYWNNKK